jgi:hypothetical protein
MRSNIALFLWKTNGSKSILRLFMSLVSVSLLSLLIVG